MTDEERVTFCPGPTHYEGCACHEAGHRYELADALRERDEARAEVARLCEELRNVETEGFLVCSSFNHHRPGCLECEEIARIKAMIAALPAQN